MDNTQRQQLLQAAEQVACKAYAPYSNFRVGAAVLGSSGQVYLGTNIENSSYGLSICAERVALATAEVNGEKTILAIGIACIDGKLDQALSARLPCGACRQWIQELAPDAEIFVWGSDQSFRLADLLPNPFQLMG